MSGGLSGGLDGITEISVLNVAGSRRGSIKMGGGNAANRSISENRDTLKGLSSTSGFGSNFNQVPKPTPTFDNQQTLKRP